MRALVLADAHISSPSSSEARDLLQFLEEEQNRTDLLILGGDLFEFFVGKQKRALNVYAPLLRALEVFARKAQVVFLEGNHDFSLAGVLPRGWRVCEEYLLSRSTQRILFIHGDRITLHKGYPLFRSFLHSQMVRFLVERMPSWIVWNGALLWAKISRAREKPVSDERLQCLTRIAEGLLAKRAEILITGHLHRPFQISLPSGLWIGLGSWQKERFYLEITPEEIRCHRYQGS